MPEFEVVPVFGGASMASQISALKRKCDILVATPGRLMDLYDKGYINFSNLRTVCIDEADYMLERGFHEDINYIYERIM